MHLAAPNPTSAIYVRVCGQTEFAQKQIAVTTEIDHIAKHCASIKTGGMMTAYCVRYARKPTGQTKKKQHERNTQTQTPEAASTVLTTMHRIIIRCELIPFPSVSSPSPHLPHFRPWLSCRSFPLHNFAYFAFGSYVSCNVYILFHFNILLKDG